MARIEPEVKSHASLLSSALFVSPHHLLGATWGGLSPLAWCDSRHVGTILFWFGSNRPVPPHRHWLPCEDSARGWLSGGPAAVGHGRAGEVRSCPWHNPASSTPPSGDKVLLPRGGCASPDLWPFGGRYRCITQQFFRKADGVIVMYDLTAKQSFLSVRQWLSSVEVSWLPS